MVARKPENLSNSYVFLQRINFTKFFKGICYIALIDAQNVVRALESSASPRNVSLCSVLKGNLWDIVPSSSHALWYVPHLKFISLGPFLFCVY